MRRQVPLGTEHAAGSLAQVGGGECRGRLQESAQFTPRSRRSDAAHNSRKSLWVKTEQAVSTSGPHVAFSQAVIRALHCEQ